MDILTAVVLEMPCPNCGRTYQVPVAHVTESQEMLNEGCATLSEGECKPLYLAALLSHANLEALRDIWLRLSGQATDHGGKLLLRPKSDG
jgi:hypothetical protein